MQAFYPHHPLFRIDKLFNDLGTIICGHWGLPATRQLDWILTRFTGKMGVATCTEFVNSRKQTKQAAEIMEFGTDI